MHDRYFQVMQDRHGWMLDRALSALLDDLHDRGLLDSTLVVAVGEFGRTPKINDRAGRDHWNACYSALVAGGGVRGGRVVGASDRRGEHPADRPVTPADLGATILARLGIGTADLTGIGLTPDGVGHRGAVLTAIRGGRLPVIGSAMLALISRGAHPSLVRPWLVLCRARTTAPAVRRSATAEAPCVRLTHDGLDKQRPSWSPDGRRLLFARHEARRDAHLAVRARHEASGGRRAGSPTARTPSTTGPSRPTGRGCCSRRSRSRGRRATSTSPSINADGTGLKTVFAGDGPALAPGLAVVVARRPPVRVQLDPRGEPGDLHGRRRRHRTWSG